MKSRFLGRFGDREIWEEKNEINFGHDEFEGSMEQLGRTVNRQMDMRMRSSEDRQGLKT